jgi:hypothetical protein
MPSGGFALIQQPTVGAAYSREIVPSASFYRG